VDCFATLANVAGAEAERTAEAILDLFIEGIAKSPGDAG
jgi:hypothetical protein